MEKFMQMTMVKLAIKLVNLKTVLQCFSKNKVNKNIIKKYKIIIIYFYKRYKNIFTNKFIIQKI